MSYRRHRLLARPGRPARSAPRPRSSATPPGLLDPIDVLWQATDGPYERGYGPLRRGTSGGARSCVRTAFAAQVATLVEGGGALTFFTDDSVLLDRHDTPAAARGLAPRAIELLCFSLRLGRNCESCYPLARPQRLPAFELPRRRDRSRGTWDGGDGDFGYPGSLDGHVFRGTPILELVSAGGCQPEHARGPARGPVRRRRAAPIASYRESHLVGVPVNRVNETHPNRFGERWPYGAGRPQRALPRRRAARSRLDPGGKRSQLRMPSSPFAGARSTDDVPVHTGGRLGRTAGPSLAQSYPPALLSCRPGPRAPCGLGRGRTGRPGCTHAGRARHRRRRLAEAHRSGRTAGLLRAAQLRRLTPSVPRARGGS